MLPVEILRHGFQNLVIRVAVRYRILRFLLPIIMDLIFHHAHVPHQGRTVEMEHVMVENHVGPVQETVVRVHLRQIVEQERPLKHLLEHPRVQERLLKHLHKHPRVQERLLKHLLEHPLEQGRHPIPPVKRPLEQEHHLKQAQELPPIPPHKHPQEQEHPLKHLHKHPPQPLQKQELPLRLLHHHPHIQVFLHLRVKHLQARHNLFLQQVQVLPLRLPPKAL